MLDFDPSPRYRRKRDPDISPELIRTGLAIICGLCAAVLLAVWMVCWRRGGLLAWCVAPLSLWEGTNFATVAVYAAATRGEVRPMRFRLALTICLAVLVGLWAGGSGQPLRAMGVLILCTLLERNMLCLALRALGDEARTPLLTWMESIGAGVMGGFALGRIALKIFY